MQNSPIQISEILGRKLYEYYLEPLRPLVIDILSNNESKSFDFFKSRVDFKSRATDVKNRPFNLLYSQQHSNGLSSVDWAQAVK